MPVDNRVFIATRTSQQLLNDFNDEIVLQVDLSRVRIDSGLFIVFGRVVVTSFDSSPQWATARLATLNGSIELDRVDINLGGGYAGWDSAPISLQGKLNLVNNPDADTIVEIRCVTYNGEARQATLFVVQVDEIIDMY
jgi:hypothetical protein